MPSTGPDSWMVRTAAALLGSYALVLVVAFAAPSRDPQRGMAYGVLTVVLLVLAGVGGLLWLGAHTGRTWLVWVVFLLSAYPAVMLAARGAYLLATRVRG